MSLIDWRKYDPKCSTCELYKKRAVPTASPAGYVAMPKALTAENGAKALLIGEFNEKIISDCPACLNKNGDIDDNCYLCDGTGEFVQEIQVSWTTLKEIYAMAVKHLAK
ncbi:MAG: hypothetical protein DBP02_01925 [gamma proteobacterium symbiont of Ctena orbiculata]|nr:MAG: hypothetical protein DBP02_01925 [gamma proteobacterium symbiont of Ctena orbiculata]